MVQIGLIEEALFNCNRQKCSDSVQVLTAVLGVDYN